MEIISNLISVVMDGSKDANMLMDYADEAQAAGKKEYAGWFKGRAKKRIDMLETDWEDVREELHIEDDKTGLAKAVCVYIKNDIAELKRRYDMK